MAEKRLYLSRNKVIAGVAGGVAEYLNVDPTIVRLIWAFTIFTGAGLIVYLIAMFIIPERPRTAGEVDSEEPQSAAPNSAHNASVSEQSNRNLGIILLLLGLFFLVRNMIPGIPWGTVWPVILIVIGIAYLFKGSGDR